MDLPDFDEIFKLMNLNYWILGIDGTEVRLRFYLIALLLIPIVFEEIGYFVTKVSSANLVKILIVIPCMSYCLVSVIKILAVVRNRVKIVELLKSVKRLYLNINKDDKKKNIVRSEILFVTKLTKYLYFLNVILVCVYNVSSLVIMLYYYITAKTVVYDFPYPVIVPFSTDAWIPWFIVYIHSITCAYIYMFCETTVDVLYFILVTHICTNFMVLSDDLLHLKDNNFANLNECIRSHQYIIQLSEDFDVIFRLPNFINVLVGSIQICALGFCIMVGEWSDVPGAVMFLSTVLSQMWITSLFGEKIISKSTQINETAWKCYWECADVQTQKIILLILMRSQKPQKMTAYMFPTICCSSFTSILSNSWSYFSILRKVYKPPEITDD